MRRSKLETYEAVLEALVKKPLTIDRIAYEADLNLSILNRRLDFLIQNGLVEERPLSKKTAYAITERGVTVFKTLNFRKYMEKISNAISTMDEALETIQIVTKESSKNEEKQL